MIRYILSTLAGVLVAVAFVFVIEFGSHMIWPPPAAISDPSDKGHRLEDTVSQS
jgi:hypothetical protein